MQSVCPFNLSGGQGQREASLQRRGSEKPEHDLGVRGFGEEEVKAAALGPAAGRLTPVTGDGNQEGLGGGRVRSQCRGDPLAVQSWQADVAEHDVGPPLPGRPDALRPRGGNADLVPRQFQQESQALGPVRVVLDDENASPPGVSWP